MIAVNPYGLCEVDDDTRASGSGDNDSNSDNDTGDGESDVGVASGGYSGTAYDDQGAAYASATLIYGDSGVELCATASSDTVLNYASLVLNFGGLLPEVRGFADFVNAGFIRGTPAGATMAGCLANRRMRFTPKRETPRLVGLFAIPGHSINEQP